MIYTLVYHPESDSVFWEEGEMKEANGLCIDCGQTEYPTIINALRLFKETCMTIMPRELIAQLHKDKHTKLFGTPFANNQPDTNE